MVFSGLARLKSPARISETAQFCAGAGYVYIFNLQNTGIFGFQKNNYKPQIEEIPGFENNSFLL